MTCKMKLYITSAVTGLSLGFAANNLNVDAWHGIGFIIWMCIALGATRASVMDLRW